MKQKIKNLIYYFTPVGDEEKAIAKGFLIVFVFIFILFLFPILSYLL